MKILITGGSAFIGSSLAELLTDKFEIYSPTSSELNLLDADKVRQYLKKNIHLLPPILETLPPDASDKRQENRVRLSLKI